MKITYVLILNLFILSFISCKNEDTQKVTLAKLPVVQIEKRDIKSFYIFPTNISGKNNNQVRPKITGYINEVLIDEGQHVKKGQILFKLETNVQDQDASSARAQIAAANATIEAANAQVQSAQVEVNRLIPLVEKNIISSVQLETARANFLKAKGQLSQAKAQLSTAQANYQGVNENIKFSTITSPIDGLVGKLNYRKGALVSPQDPNPITTISDTSEVYAYFTLNEKQFIYFFQNFTGTDLDDKINQVAPVQLELANGSIFEEEGKLETSTGQIDPNTGTIQFRVKFENKNSLLSNGSTGKVKIPHNYNQVLAIPESSTFEQQGFVYAYKVIADSVQMVTIELKDRVNNLAIIEKGLKEGDIVVAKGVGNLKNGVKIIPQKTSIDSIISLESVK